MQRGAFTLIEVMAVVVLLGLLAGSAAWSFADDAQRSFREKAIGQITHADSMARLAARRLGKMNVLRFDFDKQELSRVTFSDELSESVTHSLKMPSGHRIDRIIVPQIPYLANASQNNTFSEVDSGVLEIAYSTEGRSVSYAVKLISKDYRGWLILAGLTGQVTLNNDESEIKNLFTSLTTGRSDTY